MALTPSHAMPLGTEAPDFCLLNPLQGKLQSLQQLKGKTGTVIAFICNHCPYVIHIENAFISLAKASALQGVNFIAINSNSEQTHPQDGPQAMARKAAEKAYPFPYLFDETQNTALAYNAACTPDIYLFDQKLSLTYHGQFDESRPDSPTSASGADLKAAISALVNGRPPLTRQTPSIGCNIKWHPSTQ